jgi:uncharacterized protein with PQ loop repeat
MIKHYLYSILRITSYHYFIVSDLLYRMYITYLSFIYSFFLLINLTKQDDSVISFKPSSISFNIGDNQPVTIRLLLPTNLTFPISLQFLYDDKSANTAGYIDTIPDIIFANQSTEEQIHIVARHEGHLVLSANSSQINISSTADFVLIDIARSNVLNIFIQIVGWIYFLAWSISFYPQIILNFQRRSVIGLNFDFLALNILGHSCYCIFNLYLYTSKSVQKEYHVQHPHGVLPVLLNDVNLINSKEFSLIKLRFFLGNIQLSCCFCMYSNSHPMLIFRTW